jgi:pimeloyl-ACP methyl ester carboxylesterase
VKGRCELVKLERCGHSPFRDQADASLNAIAGFIREI